MPRFIYLDSSDFSNLAHNAENIEFATMRKLLLQGVADNKIAVPFSYVHLSEMLPTVHEQTDYAIARAKAIKAICQTTVFVDPFTFHRTELRHALDGSYEPAEIVDELARFDGKWLPGFDLVDRLKGRNLYLAEECAGTRQRRRRYMREREKLVQRYISDTAKLNVFEDPAELRDLVESAFSGKITNDELSLIIERKFFDLETLVRRYHSTKSPYGKMKESLQSMGDMFSSTYSALVDITFDVTEAAKRAKEKSSAHDLIDFGVQVIRDKLLLGLYDVRKQYAHRLFKEDQIDERTLQRALPLCQSINASFGFMAKRMLSIFDGVMTGSISLRKAPKQYKSSDAGDAQHISYLPYSDLFRCDQRTSKVLADMNMFQDGRICDTPEVFNRKLLNLLQT